MFADEFALYRVIRTGVDYSIGSTPRTTDYLQIATGQINPLNSTPIQPLHQDINYSKEDVQIGVFSVDALSRSINEIKLSVQKSS